ncbi:MAG: 3-deoxy-7-phosphoheptulonate synthase [bacterium]|nr:3-deoxy-7-phosphoheptulonate synthase [bacterium]
MNFPTDNLRIKSTKEVSAPEEVHSELPISETAAKTVFETRQAISKLLKHEDDRLMVVIGPCSIHDPDAAREYAGRLQKLRDELIDDLLIVMRVYFEKPRTVIGWKGLVNDPNLDGSFEIHSGIRLARRLLIDLGEQGMPAGTEFLDLISPQYVADLVSWGAIGARTTESQGHREMSSGLSCPIGFKNGTGGGVQIAVDAIRSASHSHHFLGVTSEGRVAIFQTEGNPDCHIILRGGPQPNYNAASVDDTAALMEQAGLAPRIMIDTSHANSRKKYDRQVDVGSDVAAQIARGDKRIFGVMIESHLVEGRQDVKAGQDLNYGQSITDACLGWENSEQLLREFAAAVRKRRTTKA